MRIVPASPAVGSVVLDVDLRKPQTDATWTAIRDAFDHTYLLVFPGQDLSDNEHVAAVSHLGPIALEGGDAPRPVNYVSNVRPDGMVGPGEVSFHIDFGFFPQPYEALTLYGLQIPSGGSETWYVSAARAAETLSEDLRQRVHDLQARQVLDLERSTGQAMIQYLVGRCDDERVPHQIRPVLWPHRKTGIPILGVWQQQTDAILPLSPEVSAELIGLLFEHLYQEQHTFVHHWSPGDLVIWDNHAVQHGRPDVGQEVERTLRRVAVGEKQDVSAFASYSHGSSRAS
jgi:taurine dioxygenase